MAVVIWRLAVLRAVSTLVDDVASEFSVFCFVVLSLPAAVTLLL